MTFETLWLSDSSLIEDVQLRHLLNLSNFMASSDCRTLEKLK
jgi:hypothetical protein